MILLQRCVCPVYGWETRGCQTTLAKAVELGFNDLTAVKMDEDLAAVRALAGFDQQLEAWMRMIQALASRPEKCWRPVNLFRSISP